MIDEIKLRALIRDEVRRALLEMKPHAPEGFVSVAKAAQIAAVSTQTIRKWITEGKLSRHCAGRVFRVRRTELDACLVPSSHPEKPESPEALAELAFHAARK